MHEMVEYRVYADGRVVHEDDFEEEDNSIPYYDDYGAWRIPKELEEYLLNVNGDWAGHPDCTCTAIA